MLFNSLHFALFFPIVFILYWGVSKQKLSLQNGLLLVASYYFYACWDWRFLFLLLFSTLLDYVAAIKIARASTTRERRIWFWLSIGINLGFLGVFKYYNFFITSFVSFINQLGFEAHPATLQIILPVGISFYTFHGLSYVIDVYNQKGSAEKNIIDYGLFVSFFPLLVAGPIERASHLLPQLKKQRYFTYEKAIDGMQQILWGLFKKIVIADNCAVIVNEIFNHSDQYSGSTLVIGALLFAFQIYGDFSGYSDIALGTARLLGIELLRNFSYPYFSRDIAEFWRRWHISLSTWFRDYLYIPLGGSQGSKITTIRNTFIIFLVSGFWHGANVTFIIWGLLHALYFMPLLLTQSNRKHVAIVAQGSLLPTLKDAFKILFTFGLTVLAWIFFRATTLTQAITYICDIFSESLFAIPTFALLFEVKVILILIAFFMMIEWLGREQPYAIASVAKWRYKSIRWFCYASILFLIFMFMPQEEAPFIYFQF